MLIATKSRASFQSAIFYADKGSARPHTTRGPLLGRVARHVLLPEEFHCNDSLAEHIFFLDRTAELSIEAAGMRHKFGFHRIECVVQQIHIMRSEQWNRSTTKTLFIWAIDRCKNLVQKITQKWQTGERTFHAIIWIVVKLLPASMHFL